MKSLFLAAALLTSTEAFQATPLAVSNTPLLHHHHAVCRHAAAPRRSPPLPRRSPPLPRSSPPFAVAIPQPANTKKPATTVYALIMLSFGAFVCDNILRIPLMKSLYLYHARWAPHQLVTSLFCHASRSHLSGNIFLLLLFGRSVEDELGRFGLLFAFAFCGIVANVCSLLLLPSNVVSIGASGAVFGLFTVSVFSRLTLRDFDWRKLVEVSVLGEFVIGKMLSEMRIAATGGVGGVNHVAHLTGAGAGVLLVVLLDKILNKMEQNEK